MAGFRKAKAEQAALKVGIYGPPGSGKTFSTLLFAEGLAKLTGKRIAFVDTERGTDFYCQAVRERSVHPEAFDFDALYTKSITEILSSIKSLDPKTHGVVVIDSITHVWEAARNAYNGRTNGAGQIPFHAWAKIKAPYKELMAYLLSSPLHAFILGRQGNEFEENEDGEMKKVGVKMKAEGETAYEPHILIRMEAIKPRKTNELATIVAYAEKDRTGVLAGRSFVSPTFESLVKPLLPLLGDTQARIASSDETAAADAERISDEEKERVENSAKILAEFKAKITLAANAAALKAIGQSITPQVKAKMVTTDVTELREAYQAREKELPQDKAA